MSHQVVSFKEQFYRFGDALDLKNKLCKSKKLKEEKIQALEKDIKKLQIALENSCDHEWRDLFNVESGRREKYCTVCCKVVILN